MNDPVLTVAEMREAERAAITRGTSELELMQRAGRGAAEWVHRVAAGRPVSVLCGPGNNGGDGYVIAETLRECGNSVTVIAPVEPKTETAAAARKAYYGAIEVEGTLGDPVVVDCLFGSGLSRRVDYPFKNLLEQLSTSSCFRTAVDVPSCVESDTGLILGPCADYDLTLALGAFKQAHFLMPAAARMGTRRLVDIGLEFGAAGARRSGEIALSTPPADAHKYSRGLVAVIGGDMPGAAILAARAAMRAGAGYVKLLAAHAHPDLSADLVWDPSDLKNALADERLSSILVGPGLGRDKDAREKLLLAIDCAKPCVVDADALHLLDPDVIEGVDVTKLCLTPHDGELAALCAAFGIAASGKLAQARGLHDVTGMAVLAKGPDSVLFADGRCWFFDRGSPWLSTAGTGDVLAGILAARLAVLSDVGRAAREAVALHVEAARLNGPAFTAGDLAERVSDAMTSLS